MGHTRHEGEMKSQSYDDISLSNTDNNVLLTAT